MLNATSIPEITVHELARKRNDREGFILLDVREPDELELARLPAEWTTLLPMSRLARQLFDALPEEMHDKAKEIIVMCHTGQRSAQVTAWLRQNGWQNVYNLRGGIAAYAREIDPSVGFY